MAAQTPEREVGVGAIGPFDHGHVAEIGREIREKLRRQRLGFGHTPIELGIHHIDGDLPHHDISRADDEQSDQRYWDHGDEQIAGDQAVAQTPESLLQIPAHEAD